jgi:mono/diheme cytochrome c family protein
MLGVSKQHPVLKGAAAIAGAIVISAVAIPSSLYLASEAKIERRYPLPAVEEPLAIDEKSVSRGGHLAAITGCADCHGRDFTGRLVAMPPMHVWSSNLRIAAAEMSDGEFERALRDGIAPDATSLWTMPSADYRYMSESDVAALLAYLRSLGHTGPVHPRPVWDRAARLALLEGKIVPVVLLVREAPSSLDLGPRYDGGRYLARISCSQCHGTDLGGAGRVPDLDAVSLYSRSAFFDLLRHGYGARGRHLPVMKHLAAGRFHLFADYEIMALYDYLDGRAHAPPALVARAKAAESRRRALEAQDTDN